MTRHLGDVHGEKKLLQCDNCECDYSCNKKSGMTKHVSIVHNKNKPIHNVQERLNVIFVATFFLH